MKATETAKTEPEEKIVGHIHFLTELPEHEEFWETVLKMMRDPENRKRLDLTRIGDKNQRECEGCASATWAETFVSLMRKGVVYEYDPPYFDEFITILRETGVEVDSYDLPGESADIIIVRDLFSKKVSE